MKENVSKQEHLPMIGVGPIIVIPQLIITAEAILMSEMGKIYSLQTEGLKISFVIIGMVLIIFGALR